MRPDKWITTCVPESSHLAEALPVACMYSARVTGWPLGVRIGRIGSFKAMQKKLPMGVSGEVAGLPFRSTFGRNGLRSVPWTGAPPQLSKLPNAVRANKAPVSFAMWFMIVFLSVSGLRVRYFHFVSL